MKIITNNQPAKGNRITKSWLLANHSALRRIRSPNLNPYFNSFVHSLKVHLSILASQSADLPQTSKIWKHAIIDKELFVLADVLWGGLSDDTKQ